jgi:transcriptional regulator with XRE-family HTH domain
MANERVRGNDIGVTGKTVGENIGRVRRAQQISLQQLEDRLNRRGRRISVSGLSKIERGERRVDVDDLMAIAVSLDVAPNALLLPPGEPADHIEVTGAAGSLGLFWEWAMAGWTPFSRDDRSFVARSLPYWVEAPGAASITWYGELELFITEEDGVSKRVQRISYAAKSAADVDWEASRR